MRNDLLAEIASALGGSVTNMNNRNKILADIVIAAGGTVTDANNRNQLLQDWLDASGGEVGSEFLDEDGFMYASSELNQNSEIWSNV